MCSHDGTLLMPIKKDELIGSILSDKYRIESEVGRGGMSIVYRGMHELMDRTVAIKVLQAQLVSDQVSVKRFQQEAQAASCIAHPNVITIHDFGIASPSGRPYLVMDFLVGESLSDIIRRDHQVEMMRAMKIFIQACDALEHAHRKGVIHRDLKSSNIMLVEFEGKKDVVKVVDFGIAKLMPSSGKQSQNLTQTGEIFGSPIYMSPEQCQALPLDARSDIYSMGAMMYESLTGQPPLMGDTILDTMQMQVATRPLSFADVRPDLELPEELEQVVFKALEKKPEDRYQSMEEFGSALQHVNKLVESAISGTSARSMLGRPRSTAQGMAAQRTSGSVKAFVPDTDQPLAPSRPSIRTSNTEMPVVPNGGGGAKLDKKEEEPSKLSGLRKAESEKKGSKLIPVLIAICVLILLAMVVAYFLWEKSHAPTM